jgi:methylthioribose-1-phosphate isomerase
LSFAGNVTAPSNVKVFNPAFDVTDHNLISAIVTEVGIIRPPFKQNIKKILEKNS